MNFKWGFNIISVSEFIMILCLEIIFYRNRASLSKISLNKKDYILTLIFGFCMTLGYGLIRGYGFDIFKHSVYAIIFHLLTYAYYIFFGICLLRYLYFKINSWMNHSETEVPKQTFGLLKYLYEKLTENKVSFYFIIFIVAWLPIFLTFFPGMLMQDTSTQILQYFHLPNAVTDSAILLNPEQYITAHHPVPHTLMIGAFLELGNFLFQSLDAGIFIFCLVQYIFVAFVVSLMFKFANPYLGNKWTLIFVVIFSLNPIFGTYAILMTKDTYFCILFILYIIKYFELLMSPSRIKDKKFFLQFLLLTIGVLLFRNNAIYSLIITWLILILFLKQKKRLILYGILFFAFYLGYSNILLPAFDISSRTVKSSLSIPFQQTAYYVMQHGDEVTEEEKQIIGKVLDYENLVENYDPNLSDPVKNSYDKFATKKEVSEYFIVWGKMFLKHPGTYVEAFFLQTYGYYFPSVKKAMQYQCNNDNYSRQLIIEQGLPLAEVQDPGLAKLLHYVIHFVISVAPFTCLITDSGIYLWVLLFACVYILSHFPNKKKYLMYYVPFLSYFIFLIAVPANGTIYFRYMTPFLYTLPCMILPLFIYRLEKQKTGG